MITEKEVGKTIAKNIRHIITEKELTQTEVAKKMGYTRASINNLISSIEQGKGTFKTICKYANALEVSPFLLFQELELKPREPKNWKD